MRYAFVLSTYEFNFYDDLPPTMISCRLPDIILAKAACLRLFVWFAARLASFYCIYFYRFILGSNSKLSIDFLRDFLKLPRFQLSLICSVNRCVSVSIIE